MEGNNPGRYQKDTLDQHVLEKQKFAYVTQRYNLRLISWVRLNPIPDYTNKQTYEGMYIW